MSIAAALLMLAQLAAADGTVADNGAGGSGAATLNRRTAPVASVSMRAQARIIRPVAVRVERRGGQIALAAPADHAPQTRRDEAGTVWIEFS